LLLWKLIKHKALEGQQKIKDANQPQLVQNDGCLYLLGAEIDVDLHLNGNRFTA